MMLTCPTCKGIHCINFVMNGHTKEIMAAYCKQCDFYKKYWPFVRHYECVSEFDSAKVTSATEPYANL